MAQSASQRLCSFFTSRGERFFMARFCGATAVRGAFGSSQRGETACGRMCPFVALHPSGLCQRHATFGRLLRQVRSVSTSATWLTGFRLMENALAHQIQSRGVSGAAPRSPSWTTAGARHLAIQGDTRLRKTGFLGCESLDGFQDLRAGLRRRESPAAW